MLRLIMAALAVLACVAPVHATPPTGDLRLVDLTGAFAAEWDEGESLPDADRIAGIKMRFATDLPGFYAAERFGGDTARLDRRLLTAIKAFPEQRAGIEIVSNRFDDMFFPALASFEATFGPMSGYPPIYLIHSLGEFDGGTRALPVGNVLMFGADMIAQLHMEQRIEPFFHHELFHLRHQPKFADCASVWCGLWTEGLAVYVASRLTPDATDAELLLTYPEPLREAVERDRKSAVCAAVERLDSTDEKDLLALFSSRRLNPTLSPRFGYYIGYLAADSLGRTRSLEQLSALQPAEVRVLLEQALRDLAPCPLP